MGSAKPLTHRLVLCTAIAVATVLGFGRPNLHTPIETVTPAYRVRIAYIIPSDRTPQLNYQGKAATLLRRIQDFYADQMEANGFGRMTFNVETTQDGRPDVHLIKSPMTASVFADIGHTRYATGKYWEHTFQSLIDAGFAPDEPGQVWLCFVEAQDQQADGSIHNDTTQGTGRFGNGFAVCSGLELSLGGDPDLIHDHRRYGGLAIPAIGPRPLLWHVSFPAYQGDDVSSLAADYISATAHELGHCFLIQHCYLNDATDCGNLMGNGFRGWRGYFMPGRFPAEDTRLDRPSALMLRLCPFFSQRAERIKYSPPPKIELLVKPGPMKLDHGALNIGFRATDSGGPGVALATLENGMGRDGVGVVAWQEFNGKPKEVQGSLSTTMINAERDDTWRVTVLDAEGNVSYQVVKLAAPKTGIGPSPSISVAHTRIRTGTPITFRGSVKRPWRFSYLWNFGDGSYGEGPSVQHAFAKTGVYEVRLNAVDPGGRNGGTSITIAASETPLADR